MEPRPRADIQFSALSSMTMRRQAYSLAKRTMVSACSPTMTWALYDTPAASRLRITGASARMPFSS